MILVSLVGEQPAPNLLPARRLGPDVAVLVHTGRTAATADNLRTLLRPHCTCLLCDVDPYHVPEIYEQLGGFLQENAAYMPLVFNLTGGTKPMVLAAYRLAQERDSDFVYFQTEGNRSRLTRYKFQDGLVVLDRVDELPETISLDDYLRLHLGTYKSGGPREELERQVLEALRPTPGLEVLSSLLPRGQPALEIDFAVRYGNQVGIGEIKTKGAKSGIDQINAVAHPRYLGTYVRKFLVSARPVDRNNRLLAEAYRIEVIEVPGYAETGALDAADREKLRGTVLRCLGGGP